MVVGVCKQQQQSVSKNGHFLYAGTIQYLCRMWKEEERHILPAGCVSAP